MFDTRCCAFLGVAYEDIRRRTLEGAADEAVLEWAERRGVRRTDEECAVWNGFMMKRGWRDGAAIAGRLRRRIEEGGLAGKQIETYFDFIDFDEGRDPLSARSWETV
jgi:gluconokinase